MGSVIDYVECDCGNKEMTRDSYYKTNELYEFCDCCGFFNVNRINNRPMDGVFPDDWKPEYEQNKGRTGFVFKIFENGKRGAVVLCVDKPNVKETIKSLIQDEEVIRFGVTFKDRKTGCYQSEIFNKQNK